MKNTLTKVTALLLAQLAALIAANARSAIDALAERGLISSVAEWETQLVAGAKNDGGKAGALLVKLAQVFEAVTTTREAIDVLANRGVIGAPEYWIKNAVEGGTCDGGNLSILLARMVQVAPMQPAKLTRATPATPTPLRDHYDIVIAGAGMGGCGAAVQAARMGRSVLLIEETDWIGGQMCAAAVTSMDEGSRLVRERGLYRELAGLIAAHYHPLGIDSLTAYWHRHPAVEPRVGRELLLKMITDARGAGVLDLVLRSRVKEVFKEGNRVAAVVIESRANAGLQTRRITSQVLIDATEWGDVIPLTGALYRSGNSMSDAIDRTKHIQDLTWTAVVKQYPDGVPNELRVKTQPPGYEKFAKRYRERMVVGDPNDVTPPAPDQPWHWNWFIGYRGMPDSTRPPQGKTITRTHLNADNDYPVTVADLEGPASRIKTFREAIVKTLCLLHFIQTELGKNDWAVANDEGYDSPFNREQMDAFIAAQPELQPYRSILHHFSIIPYARESRRIVGLHTLTAREIERKPGKPVQFPNTVALGDYPVDLHGSMTPEYLELDIDSATDIPRKFGERGGGPFAIPFECFIPVKIDGFLPAEKNISQSRLASGATRLQPHTLNMGQAVGVIAALAVQNKIQPRAVDPVMVQRVLLDAGCALTIQQLKAPWGSAEWKDQQLTILHGKN